MSDLPMKAAPTACEGDSPEPVLPSKSGRTWLFASLGILSALSLARTASADPKSAPAPKHVSHHHHGGGVAKPAAKPVEAAPANADPPPEVPAEAPKADASHGSSPTTAVVEHESHIEFDERMVKGQTAAGAIYLFQRAPTEFKTIVQIPESFRSRTVALVSAHRDVP